MFAFYRVAAAVNKTVVANPTANANEVTKLIKEANKQNVSVVVFPELTITGYTASDLFLNQTLLDAQNSRGAGDNDNAFPIPLYHSIYCLLRYA